VTNRRSRWGRRASRATAGTTANCTARAGIKRSRNAIQACPGGPETACPAYLVVRANTRRPTPPASISHPASTIHATLGLILLVVRLKRATKALGTSKKSKAMRATSNASSAKRASAVVKVTPDLPPAMPALCLKHRGTAVNQSTGFTGSAARPATCSSASRRNLCVSTSSFHFGCFANSRSCSRNLVASSLFPTAWCIMARNATSAGCGTPSAVFRARDRVSAPSASSNYSARYWPTPTVFKWFPLPGSIFEAISAQRIA
jgi:hypothetical protein